MRNNDKTTTRYYKLDHHLGLTIQVQITKKEYDESRRIMSASEAVLWVTLIVTGIAAFFIA